MNAWITGATGLVGRALLDELLNEPSCERVTAIVRRPLELTHRKLEAKLIDFERLEEELAGGSATHAFCCLGTTIKKAGSQAAFYRVDHDYPLAFGRAALAAGVSKLVVVTAIGADPGSSIFYNRVKGELEAHLAELGLPELHVLRPSLLLGERSEQRPGESIAMVLAKPLGALLLGPLAKYRAIDGRDVARAMLRLAKHGPAAEPLAVHESDAIGRLAQGG